MLIGLNQLLSVGDFFHEESPDDSVLKLVI